MKELMEKIWHFFKVRDWEKYHAPKNLILNLSSELGELAEHFRWLSDEESLNLSAEKKEEVGDEIADLYITLVYLADKLGIDPVKASLRKLEKIERKYPVEQCYGKCLKYTAYEPSS